MLDAASTPHIEHGREHTERAKKPTLEQRQVVLVFQGGGALGAYQAGVYQALHESGIEPDWIIGTSIGAINASLIAGNEPENRLDRLEEFWRRMRRKEFWGLSNWPGLSDTTSYWSTLLGGIPGFFEPNPLAFLGAHYPLGQDKAGFYSTAPLEKTLTDLVDFAHRALHAAADGRRRACANERDALLRQSQDRYHGPAYHGVRRAAAGLSGRSH
jgi:Patatin-like phospholipase